MDAAWQNGADPDYPQVFAQMAAAHMNWVRIWMNNWDGKNLEWAAGPTGSPPIGRYDLAAARRWDMIFDQAAEERRLCADDLAAPRPVHRTTPTRTGPGTPSMRPTGAS